MSQISPPIRILLVCAVAFMAAWTLFLRPKAETGSPAAATPAPATQPPVAAGGETAQSAAGQAVEQANAAKAATEAHSAAVAGEPAAAAGTAAKPAPAVKGAAAAHATRVKAAKPGELPRRVQAALDADRVVALLFWSPRAADDRAVRSELARVDRHDGKVVVHAVPMKRFADYQKITRGAVVEQSPTVVVVDREQKVETLVGFVDSVSIDQAVTDALRNS
jgi:hypothetical protein